MVHFAKSSSLYNFINVVEQRGSLVWGWTWFVCMGGYISTVWDQKLDWIKFCGRYRWMLIGNNSWPNTHKCAEQLQLQPIVYASNVDFKVATVRLVHTLSVVAVNGPPPMVTRSINTTTIYLHPFGTSYGGKQHGAVVVKAGLCLIMSVAPDRVNHYSLGWIDKVPLHPTLPIDALRLRFMARQPLRHYIKSQKYQPLIWTAHFTQGYRSEAPLLRLASDQRCLQPALAFLSQWIWIIPVHPGLIYDPNAHDTTVCQLCLVEDHSEKKKLGMLQM